MKILLFGISNVGKTTCGKLLAKKYYLREIHKNIVRYGKVYQSIKNKYFMDGKKPEEVVSDLIDQFQIRTFK